MGDGGVAVSRARVVSLLLVASGGFLGATSRFGLGAILPGPGGTLLVNCLGCAGLGAVLSIDDGARVLSDRARRVLATGFLASFTTYSTFAVGAFQADPPVAVAIVAGTYVGGPLSVFAGRGVVRLGFHTDGGHRS